MRNGAAGRARSSVKASELKIVAALTTGKGKRGIPVPGFTLYKTSKAAPDAIQQEIALRWQRQGIKVVTLVPGSSIAHVLASRPSLPAFRSAS